MQNLTSLTQSSAGNITCSKNFTVTGTTTMNGTVDLTGATVTGLTATASAVSPDADDGAALGTTALKWSDLFLASGGVINFNNGNVTLTHSAGTLTLAGGGLTVATGLNVLITKGTFNVGAFSSATAGSGVTLSASNTAALRLYADDGGEKLAAGEKRAGIARFLYATSDTDATDQTMSAFVGQVKIANDLTIGGNLAGLCGYLEVAAAKTLIGGTLAADSVATAVWGRVDLPSTAVAGTAAYLSAFAASANLGGTHTGKVSVLHVATPSAGTFDALLSIGASTGCTVANALVPAVAPDSGTMGADIAFIVDVEGTLYYIPGYNSLHA